MGICMARHAPRLYKSGHYFNGQGVSFRGGKQRSGYYGLKCFRRHASTHRVLAWLWPRDGRAPVMPWSAQVDHIDGDRSSLDPDNFEWLTPKQHARKTRSARTGDQKSDPVRGRLLDGAEWRCYPSLTRACAEAGCRFDGVSMCANGAYKYTRDAHGRPWTWEWVLPKGREGEEWRPVTLPDGRVVASVHVSNMGMVRKKKPNGHWRVVAGCLGANGYRRVWVEKQLHLVHRLVALAWLGPPPAPGMVVDHKDDAGRKDDNRVENLQWATVHTNLQKCFRDDAAGAAKRSSRVQPFFDRRFTQPAHAPFASQTDAARFAGVRTSTSIRQSFQRGMAGGAFEGRALYWKSLEHELDGPSAELTAEMMEHLREHKAKELAARLRAEDALLAAATLLVEAPAAEGALPMFERVGVDTLRFVAKDGGALATLGEARCSDVYRLTARYRDGAWRIYQLPDCAA
ncbi:MAG: hypothetical protein CMN93_07695 [Synechococcus sp. CPC35]|nr:hypothetical protein [Synechococcus sp. CPC35]